MKMLHLATLGLSCLLLFGTATAPAAIRPQPTEEIAYRESSIVYDDGEYNLLSSSVENYSIYFQSRDYNKFDLAIRAPFFTFAPTAGACAPIAGSNVLGFYDRYDENLIPNHVSGRLYGTGYIYMTEDSAVISVIRELYDLMGTDTTGTTEDDFLSGMNKYCKNKGKTMTTYSCMSGRSFDLSKAKSYIDNNLPIVFFLSGYNVGMMLEFDDHDEVSYYQSDANHVMVGFGYATCGYQTAGGALTKNFFNVSAGLDLYPTGLYDTSLSGTTINDALAIRIN